MAAHWGARGPWDRLSFLPPPLQRADYCSLQNKRGKLKLSSQIHLHSAVERAADTILGTYRMKSREQRRQGDRRTEQEQLSDVHPATWPVHHKQCHPTKDSTVIELSSPPGLRWTSRPWLDFCPCAGLRGARWASVTCTFVHITIGFFEPGNPRPGALLDFLCLFKTCQAGYAVFLPLFFQTLLKYQDIRKQTKNRVFSPQSQRHTKAFIGHRLCWRPAAVLLSGGVCF